jgi:hypothetical protein
MSIHPNWETDILHSEKRKKRRLGMVVTPVIPALGRQRQEDHEIEVSWGYIARTCFKKKKGKRQDS